MLGRTKNKVSMQRSMHRAVYIYSNICIIEGVDSRVESESERNSF